MKGFLAACVPPFDPCLETLMYAETNPASTVAYFVEISLTAMVVVGIPALLYGCLAQVALFALRRPPELRRILREAVIVGLLALVVCLTLYWSLAATTRMQAPTEAAAYEESFHAAWTPTGFVAALVFPVAATVAWSIRAARLNSIPIRWPAVLSALLILAHFAWSFWFLDHWNGCFIGRSIFTGDSSCG